jgi:CPA2 family monovalent cation:H+ antiporter-2
LYQWRCAGRLAPASRSAAPRRMTDNRPVHEPPILADFVLLLSVAVGVTLLSNRLRIPPVVGLLLTGILMGPSGLALFEQSENVTVLAEFGVVALLFTTGLEFSLARLRMLRRFFFVGGALQSFGTILVTFAIARLTGADWQHSVFFGFLITLSSTAIVLKLLSDRRELDTPHGRAAVGILLFQDFLVVPMIVLGPLLAGRDRASFATLALRFGGGLLVLGVAVLVARYVMPRLLAVLARTRVREIFILGSLVLVLSMVLLTSSLGFSAALGAFLAGILLAESDYSHQVFADVVPFRDLFSSIFFISIGLLLEVPPVGSAWARIGIAAVTILLGKALIVGITVRALRFPLRTALLAAIALSQIGEFSFVLLTVEGGRELVGSYFQIFVGASVFTMIMTPLLVAVAPMVALKLSQIAPVAAAEGAVPDLSGHVIAVGHGVSGHNLARVLREVGIRHVVIELDPARAAEARDEGSKVVFGDATRLEILEMAGVAHASVAVFLISDSYALERGIRFARQLNRSIHLIVRTHLVSQIEDLYGAGADEVVADEFETSIEIFTRVLERLHVPRNVIDAETKVLRGDAYEVFRAPRRAGRFSESILELLTAGATEIFLVREGSLLAGMTLGDLDLRARTGATIISVVRKQASFPSPDAAFQLEGGDHLILVGGHAAVEAAFRFLEDLEHPRRGDQLDDSR